MKANVKLTANLKLTAIDQPVTICLLEELKVCLHSCSYSHCANEVIFNVQTCREGEQALSPRLLSGTFKGYREHHLSPQLKEMGNVN